MRAKAAGMLLAMLAGTAWGQALFWLAQSDDDKTIAGLTDLLTR